MKKHTKIGQTTRGAKTGGIVTQEASIHVSNVSPVVEVDGDKVPTRVGYRTTTAAARCVSRRRPARICDDYYDGNDARCRG